MLLCGAAKTHKDDLWGHFPPLIISLMPLVSSQRAYTPELDCFRSSCFSEQLAVLSF